MNGVLVALALAFGADHPSALPSTAVAEYQKCDARKGSIPADCGSRLIQREDARLNAAWRKLDIQLRAGFTPQTRVDLLAEQRAWITYKDRACRFYSNVQDWGSMGRSYDGPLCKAEVIARRANELERLLCSRGPDATC